MKQNNKTQAAQRMKPSMGDCLEGVTLNLTGNAQPGACVDVLPGCSLCANT